MLHKFAATITNLKKKQTPQTCIIVKRTCISIFSKIGLVDQSNQCTQIYLQKNLKLHKLQLPIAIFEKIIISEMHHRITYIIMYFKFHPNRVGISVKTVHTNLLAKMQVA